MTAVVRCQGMHECVHECREEEEEEEEDLFEFNDTIEGHTGTHSMYTCIHAAICVFYT